MESVRKNGRGMHYVLCAAILLLSLLLLGAGRFREDLTSRRIRAEQTKTACREAVAALENGIAERYRQSWSELAGAEPELFLRACSAGMRPQ